jgi:tellurite resistance protein TehA-like permease
LVVQFDIRLAANTGVLLGGVILMFAFVVAFVFVAKLVNYLETTKRKAKKKPTK